MPEPAVPAGSIALRAPARPAANTSVRARQHRPITAGRAPTIAGPSGAPVEGAVAATPRPFRPAAATTADRGPGRLLPSLPGPVGHPSFPALLTGVLIGFAALACRGDRRDPKLADAAIDQRDHRTSFG